MKTRLGIAGVLAAAVLGACAAPSVELQKLPPLANPAAAGEVVVIREKGFIAQDFPYYLNVNEADVLDLGAGEHARFKLPAGDHRIAIRCFQPFDGKWKENASNERVVAGQTRYFTLAVHTDCATLQALTETEGRRRASSTIERAL